MLPGESFYVQEIIRSTTRNIACPRSGFTTGFILSPAILSCPNLKTRGRIDLSSINTAAGSTILYAGVVVKGEGIDREDVIGITKKRRTR
jgi:hypothetical protein